VWSRGKLRRLPTGTLFGVPDRLLPLMKSGLMSPAGLARAAMDLVLPRRPTSSADPSIADLVTPRLGSQVFDRLVEPLLGGVHAGRAAELSAHSTVPDIEALARKNRSLYLGLRKMRRHAPPATGAPVLVTLSGGLGRLVEALAARLAGDDLRLNAAVGSIARTGIRYRVDLVDGQSLAADAVVLATPAFATAGLLADLAPDAASVLGEIPYVDVATIWLSYPLSAMSRPWTVPASLFLRRRAGSWWAAPGRAPSGPTWRRQPCSHSLHGGPPRRQPLAGHGRRDPGPSGA